MRKLFYIFSISLFLTGLSSSHSFADGNPKSSDSGSVMSRLEKIESNQEEILKQLSEIKSELQIVKIRATSR